MKILLSWSGKKSQAFALLLRSWLPEVIQTLHPWMATKDIEVGSIWATDVLQKLNEYNFGIICVTSSNQTSTWLNFEAGALAKNFVDSAKVVPLLIDLELSDLLQPLAQFQSIKFEKSSVLEMMKSINKNLDQPLREDALIRAFDRVWDELDRGVRNLVEESTSKTDARSQEDMVREILDTVRRTEATTTKILPKLDLVGREQTQEMNIKKKEIEDNNHVLEDGNLTKKVEKVEG